MRSNTFTFAVLFFVFVIVLAHCFVPPGYDWKYNTISDLASQGHTYKWIMQIGFVGFGSILFFGVVGHFRKNPKKYFLLFVAIYGLSIFLSGLFCAAPINAAIPYSLQEANLHSQFATVAGIAMSLGILWQVFESTTGQQRWIRIAFLLLIGGLSGLFGLAENQVLALDKGIVQRFLYLVGLAWLIYEERMLAMPKEMA